MAYSFVATVIQVGPTMWIAQVVETECAVGDEATIDGVPLVGKVMRQKCDISAGTATTVTPVLGEVPNPIANPSRIVVQEAVASAFVDTAGTAVYWDTTPVPAGVVDPQGRQIQGARLFHRSRPDAGADNTIITTYAISSEW